jgi:DNA repair protein RadC
MQSDRIKNWPKAERPRERLLTEVPDRLTDADLLAIILRVGLGTFKAGMPGQNASDFARTLLKDFRGLRGLDRAHIRDLLNVSGLGPAKVAQSTAFASNGVRHLFLRAFVPSSGRVAHSRRSRRSCFSTTSPSAIL